MRNLITNAACMAAITMSVGCGMTQTKTLIITRPHAAEVTSRGRLLGKTPIELTEQTWAWTERDLTIRKKGYIPVRATLSAQARWVNVGVLSAGCIFGLWTLWPMALLGDRPKEWVITLKKPATTAQKVTPFQENPEVTLRPEP